MYEPFRSVELAGGAKDALLLPSGFPDSSGCACGPEPCPVPTGADVEVVAEVAAQLAQRCFSRPRRGRAGSNGRPATSTSSQTVNEPLSSAAPQCAGHGTGRALGEGSPSAAVAGSGATRRSRSNDCTHLPPTVRRKHGSCGVRVGDGGTRRGGAGRTSAHSCRCARVAQSMLVLPSNALTHRHCCRGVRGIAGQVAPGG